MKQIFYGFCLLCVVASGAGHGLGGSYKINPGDVLSLFVWNEDSLNREVLVRPDGYISMPMVGEIQAGGKTVGQIEADIAENLKRFLQDKPVVTVALMQLNGNQIFVLGKVNRPGQFVIASQTDVMQALALAGGLNAFAAEDDIKILRRNGDGVQVAIPFRYSEVKEGDELDTNIILHSGDVVVVP